MRCAMQCWRTPGLVLPPCRQYRRTRSWHPSSRCALAPPPCIKPANHGHHHAAHLRYTSQAASAPAPVPTHTTASTSWSVGASSIRCSAPCSMRRFMVRHQPWWWWRWCLWWQRWCLPSLWEWWWSSSCGGSSSPCGWLSATPWLLWPWWQCLQWTYAGGQAVARHKRGLLLSWGLANRPWVPARRQSTPRSWAVLGKPLPAPVHTSHGTDNGPQQQPPRQLFASLGLLPAGQGRLLLVVSGPVDSPPLPSPPCLPGRGAPKAAAQRPGQGLLGALGQVDRSGCAASCYALL